MIVQILFNIFASVLGFIFSFLPVVTTIPHIVGYDIDTTLVQGVALLYAVLDVFFPLRIVIEGFLVLLAYYVVKIPLRMVLGSRTPV